MIKKTGAILMGILLMGGTLLTACAGGVVPAKSGDTVRVDYTGTLDDGTPYYAHMTGCLEDFFVGECLEDIYDNEDQTYCEEAYVGLENKPNDPAYESIKNILDDHLCERICIKEGLVRKK